ncbi:MAG: 4-(cytidine 5'-diphospho)-2-C-methyl-D-erythritol kinase [Deltaproteobacteria bacterium]|nr:4-(cytidine 5'-diphospho)-2-C-methyl-D-erythritol kinase [Deltaproteobacteria bacterium]
MGKKSNRITCLSPAKINLFLQITGRRADGYHNLFSLMCCIGIYDRVTLFPGAATTSVLCKHPDVPEDDTNIAARAADIFFKSLKLPDKVGIVIEKRIPVGAGLGGGSSNAATVLNALNRYYDTPFSMKELITLGLSIGADVPFFIYGKPALVSGIGEKLTPFGGLSPYPVVLVFPGIGISTASIYKKLNLALTKCKNQHNYYHLSNRTFRIERDLCNDLEACAAARYPEILQAKEALLAHGAKGALLSGSGSSVFGLFDDSGTAYRAGAALSQHGMWEVFQPHMIV